MNHNKAPLTESPRQQLGKKMGRIALTGVAFVAGSLGAGEYVGWSMDQSSTVKYERTLEAKEKADKQQFQRIPSDVQSYEQAHINAQIQDEIRQEVMPDDPNIHVK